MLKICAIIQFLEKTMINFLFAAKKANPQADTSKEEHRIDLLVYHLYGLSFDEAKIIDAGLPEEEFNG